MAKPSYAEQASPLSEAVAAARNALLSDQNPAGYWWYTLEANESIGAGFVQLMHFLAEVDPKSEAGLVHRILGQQRTDGSWPLFFGGPADLSITVECYLALRLAGISPDAGPLQKARKVILEQGGIDNVRVFTKIHLALFGLVPWSEAPAMPVWLILLPLWSRLSIYEFSSWARASIVPLLIILDKKPVVPLPFTLAELKSSPPPILKQNLFLMLNSLFKKLEKLPWHPGKQRGLAACERWIREHLERTEDIYPAMAYGAMAIKALGYPNDDPTIRKAMDGLERFRQHSKGGGAAPSEVIHQQCCISPLWDTPWAGTALLESGIPSDDPGLLKAARALISKQILEFRGDWEFKNPKGQPGGWSFELQNDWFPDVDDTIQILLFLNRVDLPEEEKGPAIQAGLNWFLSMQSKNGGWAAFDKNNLSRWVNRIPFSDHGACLDPPTPDITGRALELLAQLGYHKQDPLIRRALRFLHNSQAEFGPWRGRWGVNFIYGTWAVLQGLAAIGTNMRSAEVSKAIGWLKSVQNQDGGWGESCLSDKMNRYVPLGVSVPSQTGWAVMALIAADEQESPSCQRGIDFLLENQTKGRWEEPYFTGTGFPGHFYIRYHGYRQYFPLLALAKFQKV